ncbi:uncharacterized protein DUF302 [Thiogranum longum]|uniref:Uncharacterized protein DUF302 n=1 Tax=Thiogranum longum TaxID=1537524 RepID=A0A4R1HE70_9GAMM|nr:DUF302 domain-containing protein [Thiogranum longum]TCK18470.1 uncharacterized protein DUF302 [Thiogranum longum]
MKFYRLCLLAFLFIAQTVQAERTVLVWETGKDLETSYDVVYKSLEDNRFFVVFEPDIQKNLSHFAERWGKDYNRNGLEGIRSMIFCNGWYANAVSNADPDMLALCPLHITLVQKDGNTRVLFTRPTVIAADSKALDVAREIEQGVSKALDEAIAALKTEQKK